MRHLRGIPRLYHAKYKDRHGQIKETRTLYCDLWQGGRRRRVPLGTDKTAAVKRLKEILASKLSPGKVVLSSMLKWVEDDYQLQGHASLDGLKFKAKHLLTFFGARCDAEDITTDRMREYCVHRQNNGAKNGTINLELAMLSRGFRLGRLNGKLTARPEIPRLKVRNARKGFFTRPEFQAIVTHLPEKYSALAWSAYHLGWRPKKELLTRQWRHVDLINGWIRLEPEETKNREGRMAKLGEELLRVLRWQRDRADEHERRLGRVVPWVYFGRRGQRICDYHDAWTKAREAAGMPDKLLYDTRRSKVMRMEAAGVSRSAGMATTGHLTEGVYRRYAIVAMATLEDAQEKVEAYEQRDAGNPLKVLKHKTRENKG